MRPEFQKIGFFGALRVLAERVGDFASSVVHANGIRHALSRETAQRRIWKGRVNAKL